MEFYDFPFSWEWKNHLNWWSQIFQRGRLNHQPDMNEFPIRTSKYCIGTWKNAWDLGSHTTNQIYTNHTQIAGLFESRPVLSNATGASPADPGDMAVAEFYGLW